MQDTLTDGRGKLFLHFVGDEMTAAVYISYALKRCSLYVEERWGGGPTDGQPELLWTSDRRCSYE